jgi:hypothetical protein
MVTALSTTKASHASRAHAVRAARSGLQARRRSQSGHRRVVEAADFCDLDGEGLEPAEQPVQSCLILERAVYHRLDLGSEPVEVT